MLEAASRDRARCRGQSRARSQVVPDGRTCDSLALGVSGSAYPQPIRPTSPAAPSSQPAARWLRLRAAESLKKLQHPARGLGLGIAGRVLLPPRYAAPESRRRPVRGRPRTDPSGSGPHASGFHPPPRTSRLTSRATRRRKFRATLSAT